MSIELLYSTVFNFLRVEIPVEIASKECWLAPSKPQNSHSIDYIHNCLIGGSYVLQFLVTEFCFCFCFFHFSISLPLPSHPPPSITWCISQSQVPVAWSPDSLQV